MCMYVRYEYRTSMCGCVREHMSSVTGIGCGLRCCALVVYKWDKELTAASLGHTPPRRLGNEIVSTTNQDGRRTFASSGTAKGSSTFRDQRLITYTHTHTNTHVPFLSATSHKREMYPYVLSLPTINHILLDVFYCFSLHIYTYYLSKI